MIVTSLDVLWMVLLAAALVAVGALAGWNARGMREEQVQRVSEERRVLERARDIHDTQRVSVARANTRPGRISKAAIDMGSSHMQQHGREV